MADDDGPVEVPLFDASEYGEEIFEDTLKTAFARFPVTGDDGEPTQRPALKTIRLKRVLGFEECTVDLRDFTVLVGANNSGKSSLLRIIRFAYTLLQAHLVRVDDDSAHLAQGRNLDDSLLPVAEVRDLWYRGIRRLANVHLFAEIGLNFGDWNVEFGLKSPFGHATSRIISGELTIPRSTWDPLMAHPIVYVPSSVGVVAHEEYRTPVRVDSLVSGGHVHEVLRNLLLSIQAQGRLEILGDILSQYFPGGIGRVEFDLDADQFISATYRGEAEHDLFNVGAGFLQVMQMVAFIVSQSPSVVLVDEPDAHLHSSLQRTTIDVLRQASTELGMQVVMATHSKEIINYVDPENLLVVDKTRDHMESLASHETAIEVLESLGSIDSVDAYYVITKKRLLLVEGKTDTKALHAFAVKRERILFEGNSRVVAIPTRGDSTPAARSDLAILESMIESQVESLQLRDRDARLLEHLEREEANAPRPLHIWRKGSIESYLIVPSAIARVVCETKGENVVSPEEIEAIVEAAIGELADDTFDRVATRFRTMTQRLDDRYVEVSEANSAARAALSEDAGGLVDGKGLLATVRRLVQEQFGVSIGTQRLLEEITEEEVDEEIWQVLDRIAALAGD